MLIERKILRSYVLCQCLADKEAYKEFVQSTRAQHSHEIKLIASITKNSE
jgi:hypothetical protein